MRTSIRIMALYVWTFDARMEYIVIELVTIRSAVIGGQWTHDQFFSSSVKLAVLLNDDGILDTEN